MVMKNIEPDLIYSLAPILLARPPAQGLSAFHTGLEKQYRLTLPFWAAFAIRALFAPPSRKLKER